MTAASHAAIPLPMAGEGTPVRLAEITGGKRGAHRLSELGLVPGVELMVVRDTGSSLLIALGDTRLALGYGVAHTVLVIPLERHAAHG